MLTTAKLKSEVGQCKSVEFNFNVAEISIEQEMTPQNQHKSTKKTSEKREFFFTNSRF